MILLDNFAENFNMFQSHQWPNWPVYLPDGHYALAGSSSKRGTGAERRRLQDKRYQRFMDDRYCQTYTCQKYDI